MAAPPSAEVLLQNLVSKFAGRAPAVHLDIVTMSQGIDPVMYLQATCPNELSKLGLVIRGPAPAALEQRGCQSDRVLFKNGRGQFQFQRKCGSRLGKPALIGSLTADAGRQMDLLTMLVAQESPAIIALDVALLPGGDLTAVAAQFQKCAPGYILAVNRLHSPKDVGLPAAGWRGVLLATAAPVPGVSALLEEVLAAIAVHVSSGGFAFKDCTLHRKDCLLEYYKSMIGTASSAGRHNTKTESSKCWRLLFLLFVATAYCWQAFCLSFHAAMHQG
jgi:hypothetical protein